MIKNLEHHKLRLTIHTQPRNEYNENEKNPQNYISKEFTVFELVFLTYNCNAFHRFPKGWWVRILAPHRVITKADKNGLNDAMSCAWYQ